MINKAEDFLKENERLDDLQLSGLYIIQNPEKFMFGMDAVLLSGFAHIKRGENVADFCTGTGILPLLLSAKTEARHFTGLEIQEESADMAGRSVTINDLSGKIDIVTGDIKEASKIFGRGVFDVITCNPPYDADKAAIKNPSLPKAIARHEILCSFDDVARESAACLVPNGRLYLVHRPTRLPELFDTLKNYKLEPKRLRVVYPDINKKPNMVLIEAIKGTRPMLSIEKPLIICDTDGKYSEEMREDYKF